MDATYHDEDDRLTLVAATAAEGWALGALWHHLAAAGRDVMVGPGPDLTPTLSVALAGRADPPAGPEPYDWKDIGRRACELLDGLHGTGLELAPLNLPDGSGRISVLERLIADWMRLRDLVERVTDLIYKHQPPGTDGLDILPDGSGRPNMLEILIKRGRRLQANKEAIDRARIYADDPGDFPTLT